MHELKNHFITSNNTAYKEGEVHVFLQTIDVEKEIKQATLYATALGVYEIELNDKKIGDQLFAPGFTYYHSDLFYQQYEVTDELVANKNILKAYVGQGWYSGRFTHENKTQIYGNQTAISWILELVYVDGTSEKLFSDEEVQEYTSTYKYAGFYDGEVFDGTLEEKLIGNAKRYIGKIPENLEKTMISVKIQEEVMIQAVHEKQDHVIIDFGQNFAGFLELNLSLLMEGTTIKIRHGEILKPDGSLYTDNLREARAELVITVGNEPQMYRPRFTYMGFRYIELSGTSYQEGLVKAFAIYSEMKRTGYFETEHQKIQRLYLNQLWGQKSNYVEVPTDCPQRDERQGYTGDGQVFARTGSYNFDTEVFWQKFLKDIHYSQMDNSEGYVAPTIPANGPAGIGFLSMLGWGNAITIIPELLAEQYGTDRYLKEYYPNLKKFIDAEIRQLGTDHLWLEPNLGDWLMHGKDIVWMASHHGPVSNSFIVHDLEVILKLATKFDFKEDVQKYKKHYQLVREAYIDTFFTEDGKVEGDYQGAYIMALKYVLPEGMLRERALSKLINHVKENGIQTGFFSTEYLLPLLADAGEIELAYDLLLNEEFAGWLYQVNRGATTMWERWDAIREDGTVNEDSVSLDSRNMVSFNHYAFGSVGEFYYQYILGIKPLEPGYKSVLLKPVVDERLKNAKGAYDSRAGRIESAWYFEGNIIHFQFQTPVESMIVLPDGSKHQVEAGNYSYKIKNKRSGRILV